MTAPTLRWRPLVAAGLVSGLVQVGAGVAMYVSGVYFAAWSSLVSALLLAAGITAGTRWYVSRVLGGRGSYRAALMVGIAIAVTTGLVYVTYNVLSISFLYPHFLEDMAQAQFRRSVSQGLDPARADAVLESLRARTTTAAIVASNLRGFCALGTVLSALTAVAFRSRSAGATDRSGEKAR